MELLKVSNITKVYNTGKGMRQFKALAEFPSTYTKANSWP